MPALKSPLCCAAALLCAAAARAGEVRVDADYPGGNVVVQRVEGNTVWVAPDQRDIRKGQWWFYWNFRLRAPDGAPVKIVFTAKNPIGVRGPALSTDGGDTWRWLGADQVKQAAEDGKPTWSFEVRVPAGHEELRCAFSPTYLDSHLQAWLARHKDPAALRVEELCRSRKGRPVRLLRAGCLDRSKSQGVVLLTSRHHACESMATYAMEGFLSAVLADDDLGRRWRGRWEVVAVPFMDTDGVEDGDSGKNRAPHDHNRDYNPKPLYPEVAAMMKLGDGLGDRLVAAIDMHCPWIRGQWNDRAYFVGSSQQDVWKKQQEYAAVLARVQGGTIRFRAEDCLPFGTAWNTGANYGQGRSFSAWARDTFPKAALVASLELAYADARGAEVNAQSARAFGRDLAGALAEFLAARR